MVGIGLFCFVWFGLVWFRWLVLYGWFCIVGFVGWFCIVGLYCWFCLYCDKASTSSRFHRHGGVMAHT